jgi:hypothetical protein
MYKGPALVSKFCIPCGPGSNAAAGMELLVSLDLSFLISPARQRIHCGCCSTARNALLPNL